MKPTIITPEIMNWLRNYETTNEIREEIEKIYNAHEKTKKLLHFSGSRVKDKSKDKEVSIRK